jgi:hypothetical protein
VPSLSGARAEYAAFSPIGFVAMPIFASPKPPPETKPAVVEIGGKERGSAEAASQRPAAAASWNTLEGGVLDSFRRLGTERVRWHPPGPHRDFQAATVQARNNCS